MFSVRILAASFKRKISPSLALMDGSDEEVPHDVECMFLKSNNVTCDVTRWVLDVFWSDVSVRRTIGITQLRLHHTLDQKQVANLALSIFLRDIPVPNLFYIFGSSN
jgi:hypothetical protein